MTEHVFIFPDSINIIGLGVLVLIDLGTGILKSSYFGIATTSRGMEKSVKKITTYFSLLTTAIVLANMSNLSDSFHGKLEEISLGLTSLCTALLYLETKSIIENLIVINTDPETKEHNLVAKFLIPVHNAMILKFKNITEYNSLETKESLTKKIMK